MQDTAIQNKPKVTKLEAWVLEHLTPVQVDEIRVALDWSKYKYSSSIRLNRSWKLREVETFFDLIGLPRTEANDYIPAVLIVTK